VHHRDGKSTFQMRGSTYGEILETYSSLLVCKAGYPLPQNAVETEEEYFLVHRFMTLEMSIR